MSSAIQVVTSAPAFCKFSGKQPATRCRSGGFLHRCHSREKDFHNFGYIFSPLISVFLDGYFLFVVSCFGRSTLTETTPFIILQACFSFETRLSSGTCNTIAAIIIMINRF